MIYYEKFGKKVKSIREAKKLTIDEVAKKANLTTTFVKYLERGKRKRLTFMKFIHLAKALKVSQGELWSALH